MFSCTVCRTHYRGEPSPGGLASIAANLHSNEGDDDDILQAISSTTCKISGLRGGVCTTMLRPAYCIKRPRYFLKCSMVDHTRVSANSRLGTMQKFAICGQKRIWHQRLGILDTAPTATRNRRVRSGVAVSNIDAKHWQLLATCVRAFNASMNFIDTPFSCRRILLNYYL